MTGLWRLVLDGCPIRDTGLARLKNLFTKLADLSMARTQIRDASLENLKDI
jgi:hypothetical protein